MKIAFFVPNANVSNIDFTTVEEGNPGVGGSEYSAILVASSLCKRGYDNVIVLCEKESRFPKSLKWEACGGLVQSILYVQKYAIDYLVVDGKFLTKEIVCRFSTVRFVAWANTFIPQKMHDFYAKHQNVVRIINVGKAQLELTKGTAIYDKSCYIYNAVPTSARKKFCNMIPNFQRANNVCYIGSLHAAKGFQYLAKAWPEVIKRIPDAQLYVIGSGKLYGRKAKLGSWGIASQDFEDEFMPYLTHDGKIMDSVHFLGILGNEKYDILSECKVGVPNPSGVSETFGYTAVEMQFMDCQVTTIRCAGYTDTVCDKSNLYDGTEELADFIVRLLKNNEYTDKPVLEYIKQFSLDNVINRWEQFLLELEREISDVKVLRDNTYYISLCCFYIDVLKGMIKRTAKKILRRP